MNHMSQRSARNSPRYISASVLYFTLYNLWNRWQRNMQLVFYSVTFNAHLQWTRTGLSNNLIWLRISSMTVKMLSISSGTEWSSHGMKCHWVSWRTKDMSSSRYYATHATHAHHAITATLCLKNIPPLCFLNNLSKSKPVFITCQYAMHVQCDTVSPILPVQCVKTWTQLHFWRFGRGIILVFWDPPPLQIQWDPGVRDDWQFLPNFPHPCVFNAQQKH